MDLNDLLSDVEGIGTDSFIRSNFAPPPPRTEEPAPVEAATPRPVPQPPPPVEPRTVQMELPVNMAMPQATAIPAPAFTMLDHVLDVEFELLVELGHTQLPLRDVMRLQPGEALVLEQNADELLNLYVHDRLIARGEALVVDGALAVKIVEVLPA